MLAGSVNQAAAAISALSPGDLRPRECPDGQNTGTGNRSCHGAASALRPCRSTAKNPGSNISPRPHAGRRRKQSDAPRASRRQLRAGRGSLYDDRKIAPARAQLPPRPANRPFCRPDNPCGPNDRQRGDNSSERRASGERARKAGQQKFRSVHRRSVGRQTRGYSCHHAIDLQSV